VGLVFNLFAAAAIWTVLGMAFEKIGIIFNSTITVFPTMPDAVNGFSMIQWAWSAIMIVIFLSLIFNYISNSSQTIPGEQ
jgi:hypothetical protein